MDSNGKIHEDLISVDKRAKEEQDIYRTVLVEMKNGNGGYSDEPQDKIR